MPHGTKAIFCPVFNLYKINLVNKKEINIFSKFSIKRLYLCVGRAKMSIFLIEISLVIGSYFNFAQSLENVFKSFMDIEIIRFFFILIQIETCCSMAGLQISINILH